MIKYFYNLLTEHPKEKKLTYLQHLFRSMSISIHFLFGAIKGTIHAFLPFLFATSSTDIVRELDSLLNE